MRDRDIWNRWEENDFTCQSCKQTKIEFLFKNFANGNKEYIAKRVYCSRISICRISNMLQLPNENWTNFFRLIATLNHQNLRCRFRRSYNMQGCTMRLLDFLPPSNSNEGINSKYRTEIMYLDATFLIIMRRLDKNYNRQKTKPVVAV